MLLKSSIEELMRGEDLAESTCKQLIETLLDPCSNPLQLSALLVLLHAKSETVAELTAIVTALREKMLSVSTPYPVCDIVGTGGDGMHTVNISTGSALLAASCGIKVAKHGNRAASSLAGSADVLEALGINIDLTADAVSHCIDVLGIGFCYAPNFHPVLQQIRHLRQSLNVPTTFNLLGPLLNPAHANHLLLGVAKKALMFRMAEVLRLLGTKHSLVVFGSGLDEISTLGPSQIIEIKHQELSEWQLDPRDYGFNYCHIDDLCGGDANSNAQRLTETFAGKPGPLADTLILNAALALTVYGAKSDLNEAINQARDILFSGKVSNLLQQWREVSHEKHP